MVKITYLRIYRAHSLEDTRITRRSICCGGNLERTRHSQRSRRALKTKMATTLENANPTVFQQKQERLVLPEEEDEDVVDKIDEREVFDILFKPVLVQFG